MDGAGDETQLEESLPSMHKPWVPFQHCLNWMQWRTPINPNAWVVEARKSEVQGHPQLHSKLESSLNYMKYCLQ